jgi:alanyl-tRNA synthetase
MSAGDMFSDAFCDEQFDILIFLELKVQIQKRERSKKKKRKKKKQLIKQCFISEPLLCHLVPSLIEAMGNAYPELLVRQKTIVDILQNEEESFLRTLSTGLDFLSKSMKNVKNKEISSELVFKLSDTYGFPIDLTAIIARDQGWTIKEEKVNELLEEQKNRSRASWKGSGDTALPEAVKAWKKKNVYSKFTGYEKDIETSSEVLAVLDDEDLFLLINPCPFYPMGGGQVGDKGQIVFSDGTVLHVSNTLKAYEDGIVLIVEDQQEERYKLQRKNLLQPGVIVRAEVNPKHRDGVQRHHTATHLLHSALRQVVGTSIVQAGSLVTEERLRFDFAWNAPLTHEQVEAIENWVNRSIDQDVPVLSSHRPYKEAIQSGAMSLFSEKYGETVRVIEVSKSNKENTKYQNC